MAYLLDANVFIEAKRRHYGMDFCPAFWEWLAENNAGGRVFSIEKVEDELRAGGDELADWAVARGDAFFLTPAQDYFRDPNGRPDLEALQRNLDYLTGRGFIPAKLDVAPYTDFSFLEEAQRRLR